MVRREFQKAYTLIETAELIDRKPKEIQMFLKNKLIDKPSGMEYAIASRRPTRLLWSEDDVLELRDRMYELLPKMKDGFPNPNAKLSSKAEILEKMNGDISYYIKNADGEHMKVWRAV